MLFSLLQIKILYIETTHKTYIISQTCEGWWNELNKWIWCWIKRRRLCCRSKKQRGDSFDNIFYTFYTYIGFFASSYLIPLICYSTPISYAICLHLILELIGLKGLLEVIRSNSQKSHDTRDARVRKSVMYSMMCYHLNKKRHAQKLCMRVEGIIHSEWERTRRK